MDWHRERAHTHLLEQVVVVVVVLRMLENREWYSSGFHVRTERIDAEREKRFSSCGRAASE